MHCSDDHIAVIVRFGLMSDLSKAPYRDTSVDSAVPLDGSVFYGHFIEPFERISAVAHDRP